MLATETVLVVGSTGNIGIAAILGVLRSGRNVIAVVRNQSSAEKIWMHVGNEHERITTIEADVLSDQGVQSVVEKVRAGTLPPFQHVFASVGGIYPEQSMLETTTEELRQIMTVNFESNFFVYQATIPYLLEQKDVPCTWTICTGASGDWGIRPIPAITQGALYSMCIAGFRSLADTNVRFNEIYLALRVEVDFDAEKHGVTKASLFAPVYENVLNDSQVNGCRVMVEENADLETPRCVKKVLPQM